MFVVGFQAPAYRRPNYKYLGEAGEDGSVADGKLGHRRGFLQTCDVHGVLPLVSFSFVPISPSLRRLGRVHRPPHLSRYVNLLDNTAQVGKIFPILLIMRLGKDPVIRDAL